MLLLSDADNTIQWYINQDEESFNDLPSWLRPTSIQMRISHPMSIWFMPW